MSRLFGSWRGLRWLVFLLSFALDAYIFQISEPFTPRSFMTSGLAAAILFFFFLEVARAMKGRGRIRRALDQNEYVTYQVGQHLLALMRKVRGDGLAWWGIWLPIWLAVLATIVEGLIVSQDIIAAPPPASMPWSTLAQYVCAGYLPLLIAIPFVLEHVSEWTSNQYVLVVDRKSHDPRLLIHSGVFDYYLETVSIERTVTTRVHQKWWQAFVGIGDVELRETAGGEGETLRDVWKPRTLEKRIRIAIKALRRKVGED